MSPEILILIAVGAGIFFLSAKTSPTPSQNVPRPYNRGLALKIAQAAIDEHTNWKSRTETDPSVKSVLLRYWTSVGYSEKSALLAISSRTFWSAAFVSYCVEKAGAGFLFRSSDTHSVYCAQAKQNRTTKLNNPFYLYRTTERAPKVGDFICRSRDGSNISFDNVGDGKSRPSHCDIVVKVFDGYIEIIGGNVDNTVTRRRVNTTNGMVSSKDFYAVLGVE